MASEKQIKFMKKIIDDAELEDDEVTSLLAEHDADDFEDLQGGDASEFIDKLRDIAFERTGDKFYGPKKDERKPARAGSRY